MDEKFHAQNKVNKLMRGFVNKLQREKYTSKLQTILQPDSKDCLSYHATMTIHIEISAETGAEKQNKKLRK